MTDDQIKHMVDRFLGWKLPEHFNPDGGISFKPFGNMGTEHQYKNEPSGTNLFDAMQARAMVRHMIEGLPNGAGWQPIETVPNNVFDVLAKYYDASLDKFLYRRFPDCVIVVSEIFTPLLPDGVSLTKAGYRPTHWRHIPDLPEESAPR